MRQNVKRTEANYTPEQVRRVIAGSGITVENQVDSDYLIFCPFHNNYRTPAGEIHKSNGTFYCFSCQKTADLIELIMHTSGRTYFEALRFIKSKEENINLEQEVGAKLITKPDYPPFDSDLVERLSTQALGSERAMSYFQNRNITKESVEKFKLGYSEKQDMVTIPVDSPEGIPIGFVGRSVEGKDFKNTPGLPKAKALFNLHRVKNYDRVYVVESSFDAIRLDQVGLPAVATLGANVSSFQTDLLKRFFNNIIVIADNDEAGTRMKEKVLEKIGSRGSEIILDANFKDIGEMSDEQIKDLEFRFDKSIESMLN